MLRKNESQFQIARSRRFCLLMTIYFVRLPLSKRKCLKVSCQNGKIAKKKILSIQYSIKIQSYMLKIRTQTNSSASAHPLLNPQGQLTHPQPLGTPPDPKNHSKYSQKTTHFLSHLFRHLKSSHTSWKSAHKPIFFVSAHSILNPQGWVTHPRP